MNAMPVQWAGSPRRFRLPDAQEGRFTGSRFITASRYGGMARQYCGELGKVANCQVLVSLTLARGEVPLPVGLRLFLPAAWTDDPERCEAAGVPEAARTAQTKPEIALAEIDRMREAGLRFSCVLADAGFGSSPAFRHGLDERGLPWAAGVACTQMVYPTTVKLRPART